MSFCFLFLFLSILSRISYLIYLFFFWSICKSTRARTWKKSSVTKKTTITEGNGRNRCKRAIGAHPCQNRYLSHDIGYSLFTAPTLPLSLLTHSLSSGSLRGGRGEAKMVGIDYAFITSIERVFLSLCIYRCMYISFSTVWCLISYGISVFLSSLSLFLLFVSISFSQHDRWLTLPIFSFYPAPPTLPLPSNSCIFSLSPQCGAARKVPVGCRNLPNGTQETKAEFTFGDNSAPRFLPLCPRTLALLLILFLSTRLSYCFICYM